MGEPRESENRAVIGLTTRSINSVAVIGAHCDDVAIGVGGTLLKLSRDNPGLSVHALVLTGKGTQREAEEIKALAEFCGSAEVHLTVTDFPDGRLPRYWGEVKQHVSDFRRSCAPDVVFGPQRGDWHQDHRLLAELMPTEFRDHLTLGYEVLKWESDLPSPSVFVPVDDDCAQRKVELLAKCYPSQAGHDWFDDEAFLGLMRIRGAQCRSRYAEAFLMDKAIIELGGRDNAGPVVAKG